MSHIHLYHVQVTYVPLTPTTGKYMCTVYRTTTSDGIMHKLTSAYGPNPSTAVYVAKGFARQARRMLVTEQRIAG